MLKTIFLSFCCLSFSLFNIYAQTYLSYFSGDTADIITTPQKGVCLMGGAGEDDNAMKWFLQRAAGGDILVLRTDDSDGYQDYLFSDLGIDVNSVETIVCNSADASTDAYVLQQIKNAEALWFAGGDQWNYVSYWRDTPVEDAINEVVNVKGITIGGISAGMAIQGQVVFTAENGSITSFQALSNPYSTLLTLAYDDFIENPVMEKIITDTHFDDPDRRGRTTTFLARILNDYGFKGYAIACNEYNAVCIDENKIAHCYGEYPEYEDHVYFIQINCIEPSAPEKIVSGDQLDWRRNNAALKVLKMNSTTDGTSTLDLNDWQTVSGGYSWENWWVEEGIFKFEEETSPLDCDVAIEQTYQQSFECFPNPVKDKLMLSGLQHPIHISIKDLSGNILINSFSNDGIIDVHFLTNGLYMITCEGENYFQSQLFCKQ